MPRPALRVVAIALIFLFLGSGTAAAVMAFIPNEGSPAAIYDDFGFSSTQNGYWHENPVGATARIKHSILTLTGDSIELDHRIQTDDYLTVMSLKIRGLQFHKFGFGLGVFHAGTIGMEFDNDGAKCGRASDYGWQVDFIKGWTKPPTDQWFYLQVAVKNPYPIKPPPKNLPKTKYKHVTLTCSVYDSSGHLIARTIPTNPPANTNYAALDEAFVRTWDSDNKYQIDWLYAGPASGDPLRLVTGSSI
jgi:hypothetical protein